MSDEAVLAAVPSYHDKGEIKYTLKHYLEFNNLMREKAASLNNDSKNDFKWTAQDVQKVLFTAGVIGDMSKNELNSKTLDSKSLKSDSQSQSTKNLNSNSMSTAVIKTSIPGKPKIKPTSSQVTTYHFTLFT